MSWRLAGTLIGLRDEINAYALVRSTVSDGTIGDSQHAARQSDHNPNAAGVVCAFDITQDPIHGADMAVVSEFLRRHLHPSCTYLIWDRRIAGPWRRGRPRATSAVDGLGRDGLDQPAQHGDRPVRLPERRLHEQVEPGGVDLPTAGGDHLQGRMRHGETVEERMRHDRQRGVARHESDFIHR